MLLRVSVLLLVVIIVLSFNDSECRKKSSSLSSRHTSRPKYVIRTTTSRSYRRTTTRRHLRTTTKRYYIKTTTPRTLTRYTTRRKTTTRVHHTTTPRITTKKYHIQTTTPHTRPPPYNPYFTSSIPSVSGRLNKTSKVVDHTRPPPYNPFFSTTTAHTKPPPFNPFFTSSKPPISENWQKTSKGQLGSEIGSTKPPPYNPFLTTPTATRTTRQSLYNPFHTTARPPGGLNKTSQSQLGSGIRTTRPPSDITRPPPFNPFFTSSRPLSLNKTSQSHLGTGIRATKPPTHNSTVSSNRTSSIPRPPPYNPFYTTLRPSVSGRLNKTSNGQLGTGTGGHIGFVYPSPTTPKYNGPVWKPFWNSSKLNKGTYHPTNSPNRDGNRFTDSSYDPLGQKRNVTSNFGQPFDKYPRYPGHGSDATYHPGGHYNPGVHQQSVNIGVTIINNNVNNHNHRVIYPTQHYSGYGRPPSGVTIINNNVDNFYPDHQRTTYHYSHSDTGSNPLGFFLGYQLGKISRPSYHYHSTSFANNRYVPIYDHYEVHHYYHNKESVPKMAEITANTIVSCAGDSGRLCPEKTVPLCTNNAAVMCVASSVVPCDDNKNLECVKSSVPCVDKMKECNQENTTQVSIPCISTARVLGGITFIDNNTIVASGTGSNAVSEQALCVTVLALPAAKQSSKPAGEMKEISIPFHYTTNDTGIDPLGYFLGQQLEDLVSPSYLYLNYDKNYKYVDKYDHYNIHHYYHNGSIMQGELEVQPNTIMSCVGDSGTICPQNTRSLCFTDGAVACVTDITSSSFINETNAFYVNSSIPCENNKAPLCRQFNGTISVNIPCISIAKIYANMSNLIASYVTNSATKYYNTLVLQPSNTSENATVSKIAVPRQFCITLLLTPGEKITIKAPAKRKIAGVDNSKAYATLRSYTYSPKETGNNTLGYYLTKRIGLLKYPTYYYINDLIHSSGGVIQKFDHYSVHQYYQGKEVIPSTLDIQAVSILPCAGDSGTICPVNTTSLCLNDGSVMCATDYLLTTKCEKIKETNCVKSVLPCLTTKAPKCKKGTKRVQVTMPCISVATIFGDIGYVNNSIYVSNKFFSRSYVDIQPITNANGTVSVSFDKAQQFCVTIAVLPSERKISEGEKILESSKDVFVNFALNLFGL